MFSNNILVVVVVAVLLVLTLVRATVVVSEVLQFSITHL